MTDYLRTYRRPTIPFTDSRNFAESNPIPRRNTISVFRMSADVRSMPYAILAGAMPLSKMGYYMRVFGWGPPHGRQARRHVYCTSLRNLGLLRSGANVGSSRSVPAVISLAGVFSRVSSIPSARSGWPA